MRLLRALPVVLASASALAGEHSVFLEVHNTGPRLYQRVVEHRVPLAKLFPTRRPMGVRVTETDAAARPLRKGVGQLDVAGGQAVLSLLLGGVTEPGQRRTFLVEPTDEQPPAGTDLRLDEAGGEFLISNQFFTAHVARRGRGGFPDKITLNGSGNTYDDFFYGDRLYTKERGSLHLRDDNESTARIVSRGPLRIVAETSARYGPPDRYASGNAKAVYRYVYRAYSPVVDVTCRATRTDDYEWSEIHFLQVSRRDSLLGRWVGGSAFLKGTFQNTKQAKHLSPWGVMHNADDAVGLACDGSVMLYDGLDYYNYLQTPVPHWTARTYEKEGRLYFGPAHKDPQRYAQALAAAPGVAVRQLAVPKAAAPPTLAARYRLESNALALEFADEPRGLGLVRLTNKLTGQPLAASREEKPLLWRIELRSEDPKLEPITIDNRVEAKASAQRANGKLTLTWQGIALADEPNALTVRATIELKPDAALSAWHIKVANRSKRYGAWDILFPVISNVGPDERLDVAVPRSNWGMLYRECRHRQAGWYPCANWPMQFLTANRGEAGLYLACHDPEAWPKRFSLTPLGEFNFQFHAPNQGIAGTGFEHPFPIVVGAYQGDWWAGAKLYRQWVTANAPWTRKGPIATRKDTPKKLLELGLWMLGGGHAKEVVPNMRKAAELFRVPIGIHWYNWHKIPFDTYYPNYFPTKPGFAEAVRELTGKGMVIMPYINGRLWDSGNDNFKQALPFATKNTKGQPYIEVYGSKVPLAVMCPHTQFWQDKVVEICRRLMAECGVNAIYLDQIAAAGPKLCYDKSHGHALAGGSWWVDGYRKMLTRINTLAHSEGRDVIITSENNAEPYMDNVDCLLTWNPRYDHEIPMVTAVYSGYTTYFASISNVGDATTAFAMSQGRDFLFGVQPGWMGFELLAPRNRAKAEYLRELAEHRLAASRFMHLGELLGELKPTNGVPKVEVTWGRNRPHKAVLPAAMATVWRSRDGELAIAMTNWDDRPHVFRHRFDPDAWGGIGQPGQRPSHLLLTRLTPKAALREGCAPYGAVECSVPLRSREVRVVTVTAAPPLKSLVADLASQIKRVRPRSRVGWLWGSVTKRCHTLLAVPGDPKAMAEPLGVRLAKQCATDILMAEMGLAAATEPMEIVAASDDRYSLKVVVHNRGTRRRKGVCSFLGTTRPYDAAPGQKAEVEFSAQAPHLAAGRSVALFEQVRVHPSNEARGPARVLTVPVTVVQPLTVQLDVAGAPRAGEDHMVRASVTNHTAAVASPTLVVQAPAGWEVRPGRRLRLPMLQPRATRVVTFRCAVPRDAIPGRTRVSASVSLAGAEAHVDVAEPRPQAKAKHRNGAPKIDGDLTDWRGIEPVGLSGGKHVRIEGWKGAADCSAKVWTGWNAQHLFVAAEVTDDTFDQKQRGYPIWQGDCIQVALCPGPPRGESGYGGVVEFGLALTPGGPQVWQWIPEPRDVKGATLVVKRSKGRLAYEAAIPWSSLGGWRPAKAASLGWSFTVNDADGKGFRGWLEWTPGVCGAKDAAHFGRLVMK